MKLFMEINLTLGYITEIVAQRSGDLQIENLMPPSARLLICAMWPPEAHEFDTPGVTNDIYIKKGFFPGDTISENFTAFRELLNRV